jgi:hypothetical protein
MSRWDRLRVRIEGWEGRTAVKLERVLRKPAVLRPMGTLLTTTMRLKRAGDRAVDGWWSTLGLPTRRAQERTLHAINQLNSRLLDLEEALAVVRRNQGD